MMADPLPWCTTRGLGPHLGALEDPRCFVSHFKRSQRNLRVWPVQKNSKSPRTSFMSSPSVQEGGGTIKQMANDSYRETKARQLSIKLGSVVRLAAIIEGAAIPWGK